MQYKFVNQYRIEPDINQPVVVIFEREHELRMIYASSLEDAGFLALGAAEKSELLDFLTASTAHALVINPFEEGDLQIDLLKQVKQFAPHAAIITVGFGITDKQMRRIMDLGVASHVNRHLTRPEDVALVLKTLINH